MALSATEFIEESIDALKTMEVNVNVNTKTGNRVLQGLISALLEKAEGTKRAMSRKSKPETSDTAPVTE